MASHVEKESFVIFRSRQSPDPLALFQDNRMQIQFGKLVRRSQTGGSGADDDNLFLGELLLSHGNNFPVSFSEFFVEDGPSC